MSSIFVAEVDWLCSLEKAMAKDQTSPNGRLGAA